MKKFLIFLYFLYASNVLAQKITSNSSNPCPNENVTYTWTETKHHDQNTYTIEWTPSIDLGGGLVEQTGGTGISYAYSWMNTAIAGEISAKVYQISKDGKVVRLLVDNYNVSSNHKRLGDISTISSSMGTSIPCGTQNVVFSVPAVQGATSYRWTLPSGWSGSSSSNTINATTDISNGGQIRVEALLAGCSISRDAYLSVSRLLPQISYFDNSTSSTCSSATVSVTANNATSYEWSTPTGTFSTTNNAIQVATTGFVKVRAYSLIAAIHGLCGRQIN